MHAPVCARGLGSKTLIELPELLLRGSVESELLTFRTRRALCSTSGLLSHHQAPHLHAHVHRRGVQVQGVRLVVCLGGRLEIVARRHSLGVELVRLHGVGACSCARIAARLRNRLDALRPLHLRRWPLANILVSPPCLRLLGPGPLDLAGGPDPRLQPVVARQDEVALVPHFALGPAGGEVDHEGERLGPRAVEALAEHVDPQLHQG
eukprot:1655868-Alexandrium_andersonii.AAC.1